MLITITKIPTNIGSTVKLFTPLCNQTNCEDIVERDRILHLVPAGWVKRIIARMQPTTDRIIVIDAMIFPPVCKSKQKHLLNLNIDISREF